MGVSLVLALGGLSPGRRVEGRIKGIEIAAVQFLLGDAEKFPESLVMNQLPFPEEPDGFAYIVVPDHAEDIVIGGAGFLFCSEVFVEVRNYITFGLKFTGIERNASGGLGPDAGSVVDIVRAETLVHQFLGA